MNKFELGGLIFFTVFVLVGLVRNWRRRSRPLKFRILKGEQEKRWLDAVYQPKRHRR